MSIVLSVKTALAKVVDGLVLLAKANSQELAPPPIKPPHGPENPKPGRFPAILFGLILLPHSLPAAGFSVIGPDPGAWPQILSSLGHQPARAVEAGIFVGRPGAPASPNWPAKLAAGCVLILEGESPLAASFGFQPTAETVRLASLQDVHRPNLPIILEKAIDIHRFQTPPEARIFAQERWTSAPVIAGMRRGPGAVLWVAASPGKTGYERFPYILHALADLGLDPPFHSGRLWAFFDYSYRSRADVDYLAARWRKSGIGSLHVASWHFYESDPVRDAYLKTLIDACHRQAITVYAWVELPHVSERFWNDHPEWREKTAVLQDAHLDWRKLMNLTNRACFRAVSAGEQDLIHRFDWDGVNLAELYFESLEGSANPARFTPMNPDVRAEFKAQAGWDPIEIYGARKDAASLRAVLDFRAALVRRMQGEWLAEAETWRRFHPDLDVVLTHVDDRFDEGMKDAIGADAGAVLPLLDKHDFTFLIEDPATVWNLGPQRYPEIARRYQPLTPRPERLAIDINVVDRYQDVYPTRQQTGTELFQLVHLAAAAFPRVALYFENSILPPDLPLLSSAASVVSKSERVGEKLMIESPYGVGIPWLGAALVDGKSWPALSGSFLWVPAGAHSVESSAQREAVHLLDFNGVLESAESLPNRRIEIGYSSGSRAVAVLDCTPLHWTVDGIATQPQLADAAVQHAILLPRGRHRVTIQTD